MISGMTRPATGAGKQAENPPADTRRRGVLLINLGTPDRPDVPAVRKYLAEFLSDPEVIHLPSYLGWLHAPLGRLIARLRASKSAEMYRKIWTERGSPLGSITRDQAAALASALPAGWRVFHAMRYGRPSIAQTLAKIEAAGVEELVVVPMYPQFSGTTTGTAVRELYDCLKCGGHHLDVSIRNSWYDDAGYVYAQARLIHEYARTHGLSPKNSFLVFSAHGLPVSYVEGGDPYPDQVRRSIELIVERLGWPADRYTMGYQSRMGPAKWLEPNVDGVLRDLAQTGERRLLVCPISFTVDCLETLEEIDVRYRELVEACGSDLFLCPALNSFQPFVVALKELILRGPRPVVSSGERTRPLLAGGRDPRKVYRDTDSLIMIGASMENRVGPGMGPPLAYSTESGLHKIKRATCEVPSILREICEQGGLREAFLWNTCHRFEFYGWLAQTPGNGDRERVIAQVKKRLFNDDQVDNLWVNVLVGQEAWHHLMRSASGLNSGLPGDRDVLEQLRTAQRVAERAGTAGRLVSRLISDAVNLERDLRADTAWGEFDPGYCFAALSRVVDATGLSLADCRCLVLGGSTTSRSVLTTLARRFEVPTRRLTLVYRGHGSGQIKLLRKAIGEGKRVRVGSYGEEMVTRLLADADVVVFGVDSDTPVLSVERVSGLRNYTERPLTIIDFNTFGSIRGLAEVEGVRVWNARQLDAEVMAFAEAMCASVQFDLAVQEAEQWIVEQTPVRQCPVAVTPTPAVCHNCSQPSGRCARLIAVATGGEHS